MIKPFRLACNNWKVLLKSLLYQALLLALVVSLGILIFGSVIDDIIEIARENNIRGFVSQTVNSLIAGEFDSEAFTTGLNAAIKGVQQSIAQLDHPWGLMEISYILVVVILVLYRAFNSLTDVAVACQLDEFMTSNASRPFTWFFFKKQGRTWEFVLLQTLLTLPLDILIVTGSIGFYLLFLLAFNWWTIIPVAVIALVFYVARQTLFAFCLPAVACEEISARKAFKLGLSKIITRFWRVFWKTLIVVTLMIGISATAITYVHNPWVSTLLSTLPNFILFFLLKCINMEEYFLADNRPYFYKRVDIEGTDRYNRKMARRAKKGN